MSAPTARIVDKATRRRQPDRGSRQGVLVLAKRAVRVIDVCLSDLHSVSSPDNAADPRSTFGQQFAATQDGVVGAGLSSGTYQSVSRGRPVGLADPLLR